MKPWQIILIVLGGLIFIGLIIGIIIVLIRPKRPITPTTPIILDSAVGSGTDHENALYAANNASIVPPSNLVAFYPQQYGGGLPALAGSGSQVPDVTGTSFGRFQSISVPPGFKVVFYGQPNYQALSANIVNSQNTISVFNTKVVPFGSFSIERVPIQSDSLAGVLIWKQGIPIAILPGFDPPDTTGTIFDGIQSIRANPGFKMTVWSSPNFQGQVASVQDGASWTISGFTVKSIKIESLPDVVYLTPDGRQKSFSGPLDIPEIEPAVAQDITIEKVSSLYRDIRDATISVRPNAILSIYPQPNYQGNPIVISGSNNIKPGFSIRSLHLIKKTS